MSAVQWSYTLLKRDAIFCSTKDRVDVGARGPRGKVIRMLGGPRQACNVERLGYFHRSSLGVVFAKRCRDLTLGRLLRFRRVETGNYGRGRLLLNIFLH